MGHLITDSGIIHILSFRDHALAKIDIQGLISKEQLTAVLPIIHIALFACIFIDRLPVRTIIDISLFVLDRFLFSFLCYT